MVLLINLSYFKSVIFSLQKKGRLAAQASPRKCENRPREHAFPAAIRLRGHVARQMGLYFFFLASPRSRRRGQEKKSNEKEKGHVAAGNRPDSKQKK